MTAWSQKFVGCLFGLCKQINSRSWMYHFQSLVLWALANKLFHCSLSCVYLTFSHHLMKDIQGKETQRDNYRTTITRRLLRAAWVFSLIILMCFNKYSKWEYILRDCPFLCWVSQSKKFSSTSQYGFLFTSNRVWDLGIPSDTLSAVCDKDRMQLSPLQQLRRKIKAISAPHATLSVFNLTEQKIYKQTNKGKRCHSLFFGLQCWSIFNHSWFSVANRSNFVIFLIPLLFGHKKKEKLVFSSLTHYFLDKLTDYLNHSVSPGPLPFALSTWKSIELILSPVRVSLVSSKYFLSYIIHINYCTLIYVICVPEMDDLFHWHHYKKKNPKQC